MNSVTPFLFGLAVPVGYAVGAAIGFFLKKLFFKPKLAQVCVMGEIAYIKIENEWFKTHLVDGEIHKDKLQKIDIDKASNEEVELMLRILENFEL